MNIWQVLDVEEKQGILYSVSSNTGLLEMAIEKDWWVCIVLKAIFQTHCASACSFKGGTSLSKSFDLVKRFSEDADVALFHSFFEIDPQNKSQREKLRKKARKYIQNEFVADLDNRLKAMGVTDYFFSLEGEVSSDKDPTVIYISYPSIVNKTDSYITPVVKIEMGCLSMSYPTETRTVASYISQYYPTADGFNTCDVQTVSPSRTFLEKIFLLSEELCKDHPRHKRMSRHLYDLEKMMDSEYGKIALQDTELYRQIVKHRAVFNHKSYFDVAKHHPFCIEFIPSKEKIELWEKDYETMQTSFIYGESLPFDALILRMEELKERIRAIKTDENFLND
jgi:hypothetical protein